MFQEGTPVRFWLFEKLAAMHPKLRAAVIIVFLLLFGSFFIVPYTLTIWLGYYGYKYVTKPLSRPNSLVSSYVQKTVPIGTDWNEAIALIEGTDWKIRSLNPDYGLIVNQEAGYVHLANANSEISPARQLVGKRAIYVYLGEYQAPFDSFAFAYLAFDDNGSLIEIYIEKDIDSL